MQCPCGEMDIIIAFEAIVPGSNPGGGIIRKKNNARYFLVQFLNFYRFLILLPCQYRLLVISYSYAGMV